MNSFEEFTVLIGLLAVLFEGIGYARSFIQQLFRKAR